MSDFKIVDKSGSWVVNKSEFPLPDYTRVGGAVLIEPGVPTKIDVSDFLKGQATLEILTVDPITGEEIKPRSKGKIKTDLEKPADPETPPQEGA